MGFAVGLGIINVLLRQRSVEEIKKEKSLRWTYGLAVWGIAAIGAWLGVTIYNNYFY
ncbi:MAG TPA: hypothetical protein PLK85_00005 [Alphaproteobacteria bacterium]|nr:hypothetical protein [Alphaproteobacteria bacterium]